MGPGSALYGSGATIGVINLITKSGNGSNRFSAYTSVGTGSSIQGDMYGSINMDDLMVNFSAGGLQSEGFPRRDGSSNENWPLYISRHPLSSRFFLQGHFGSYAFCFSE